MNVFTNRGSLPTSTGFGEGLVMAGEQDTNVVVLGADISASVKVNAFAQKFPKRFYSLGIAEQNCIGIAAGLALSGRIPVFSTYAAFAALRTTDQIRVSLCYNNLHVVIGGAHAGISVGADGATHQALEDIAIMRVLPNMTVLSPCDATQTRQATIAAIEQLKGPVYIRFGREAVPDFIDEKIPYEIGKGQLLREGANLTIIATGNMVWEALQAAIKLDDENISVRVINIHTIKPIDKDIIIKAARETGAIVTAEEHQIMGGFGSAVAEVLAEHQPVPISFAGISDSFGESGQPDELMEKYGLTSEHIMKAAKALLKRKVNPKISFD
jgi:transketolase